MRSARRSTRSLDAGVLGLAVAVGATAVAFGFGGCSDEEAKTSSSGAGGEGASGTGGPVGPTTSTTVSSSVVGSGGAAGTGGMGGMPMRNPCKDLPPPMGLITCGTGNAGAGGGPPASCDISCTDGSNNVYDFTCTGWDCSCNYNGMHVCDCSVEGLVSCGDDTGAGGGGGAGGAGGAGGGGGGGPRPVVFSSCCG